MNVVALRAAPDPGHGAQRPKVIQGVWIDARWLREDLLEYGNRTYTRRGLYMAGKSLADCARRVHTLHDRRNIDATLDLS